MPVLVLVSQAVHVLVSPEVCSVLTNQRSECTSGHQPGPIRGQYLPAAPVNHEVRPGAALQAVRLVPELELASVSHDQGLDMLCKLP